MPFSVTIDRATYDLFCEIGREFNEYIAPERMAGTAANAPSNVKDGGRPGDEYNRNASWSEILEPAGWKVDHTTGQVTYWRRPGKEKGHSATTGKCHTEGSGDLLYVFTSSAAPFEQDAGYSKFAAYTVLNHQGDYKAAGKALYALGYGRSDPANVVFGPGPQATSDSPGEPGPDGEPKNPEGVPDDGVAPDFDFATNEDLKRADVSTQWVWDLWFQRSVVNLVAAEAGLGKTRFMADLCRRIAMKLPWPDGTPTPEWESQYIAMWVAADRNHGELLTLSEKFGFGERICYSGSKAVPLEGLNLNTMSDFHGLYRRLKAARPMFLIVDTAGGSTSYNLAKQEEARSFFSPLSDIAGRLNICVVVITHLNASKNVLGKRAEERVRVVLRMSAENRESKTPRRLEIVKSNSLFPEPLGMILGSEGNEYNDTPPVAPESGYGSPHASGSDSPERGPPTRVRECSEWLEQVLADRPRKLFELIKEAQSKGFDKKLLYRARSHLNLIEDNTQPHIVWGLRRD